MKSLQSLIPILIRARISRRVLRIPEATAVIRDDQGHALPALVPAQSPAPVPVRTDEDDPLLDVPTARHQLHLSALPQDLKLAGVVDPLLRLPDIVRRGIQMDVIMTVVQAGVHIQVRDGEGIGTSRVGLLRLHLVLDTKNREREAGA